MLHPIQEVFHISMEPRTKVAPSGLLPSEREIPLGSSRDGIRDAPKALWMRTMTVITTLANYNIWDSFRENCASHI